MTRKKELLEIRRMEKLLLSQLPANPERSKLHQERRKQVRQQVISAVKKAAAAQAILRKI